jgi:FMN phosphatase YigB (HAD superfamily)
MKNGPPIGTPWNRPTSVGMLSSLQAVIFDWGDTLMRDLPEFQGAMVHWPRVELIPGVVEALGSIHGRLACCVASNAGDSDAELMGLALERVGIRHFFDHLWTSRELGATKPNPAFYRAILRELDLEPEACIMVGNDYEKDIAPAKAMGMWTIWLGRSVIENLPAADAIIHTMEDLYAAINLLVNTEL